MNTLVLPAAISTKGVRAIALPDAATAPADEANARFTVIYRATYPEVLAFISRRLIPRDHARAEEIAHDTYLIAWNKFASLPGEIGGSRAWLFTTARHLILKSNDRKRRGDLGVRISDDAIGFIPAADDEITTHGARMDLMSAWCQLNAAEQEVISLTYWDELTSAEAGRVLGISDRAYRTKLHRARTKLRHFLDGK